eukprot:NODE_41_length_34096_cov_2.002235.p7 type:complete len:505 gc:universal NODE_41_length_34096_cov_2.002235:14516-16030(+)
MKKIVIVGFGEAGKSCYRILHPIQDIEVININKKIDKINSKDNTIHCNNEKITYDYLVLCTGASPKELSINHPHIKTTRDFNSIQQLAEISKKSNRIAVLGNGGVALEVVNEFRHVDLLWIFKDRHIGKDFFDEETCKYFYPFMFKKGVPNKNDVWAYLNSGESPDLSVSSSVELTPNVTNLKGDKPLGPALGPIWKDSFRKFLKAYGDTDVFRDIRFEAQTTIQDILSPVEVAKLFEKPDIDNSGNPEIQKGWRFDPLMNIEIPPSKIKNVEEIWSGNVGKLNTSEFPLYLKLKNGKIYGVDYLICGLGVKPNTSYIDSDANIALSAEYGILVDDQMRTYKSSNNKPFDKHDNIFAAGDVSTIYPLPTNFVQKRLWSQARIMGIAAAHSIIKSLNLKTFMIPNESCSLTQFCMLPSLSTIMLKRYFENFIHVTSFFGLRTVFLGKYNGQGLSCKYEYHRAGNGIIKYAISNEKIRGAIIIGDTGMEVFFSNLGLRRKPSYLGL